MAAYNLIHIVADDLAWGDVGAFGDGVARTPHIDRLVAEGMALHQSYAASCVCAPSRASLLTGRYPHRTGAIDTLDGRGLDRLNLRERTIADMLRAGGYRTGLVGKWHNGAHDPAYHPRKRGFDEFVGIHGGWSDYWAWTVDSNGEEMPADGRYLTDVLADAAVDFVGRNRRQPFYLQLAYTAPHFPLQAPEDLVRHYEGLNAGTRAVCVLRAMVEVMDRGIGQLVDALKRNELDSQTLIVFTSDNGPDLGGSGAQAQVRSNLELRGGKLEVFEGGVRVPTIAWLPGVIPAGATSDAMVHGVDWVPTFLDLAGCPLPSGLAIDGISLVDVLRGGPERDRQTRFWQWNRYTPVFESNAAMREGPWKLVHPAIAETMDVTDDDLRNDRLLRYHPSEAHVDFSGALPTVDARGAASRAVPMLFNVDEDPSETLDVANEHPDRVRQMTEQLRAWFESVEAERRLHAPRARQ